MRANRGLRLTLLAVFVALTAQAQSPSPAADGRAPDALLAEVRLLRLASEREARVNVLVARALLQQGRVGRTQLQVERLEGELSSLARERGRLRTAETEYERAVAMELDSSRRHTFDLSLKTIQAQQKQHEAATAEVQERLLLAKQALDLEGHRIDELAARLDLLERELQRSKPD